MGHQQTLHLEGHPAVAAGPVSHETKPNLNQYWTPFWAAAELTDRYFPDLCPSDRVIELSCGDGAFLAAVPDHVEAVGVDIDPAAVELARHKTGRRVMVGDCATITPPGVFTTMLGNPSFDLRLFLKTLENAKRFTTPDARGGWIVPSYFVQTPDKVLTMARDWSMRTVNLPRTLFPGLSKPLMFLLVERSTDPVLTGFALYAETQHMTGVDRAYQDLIARSKSGWVKAIARCIASLGGSAPLDAIYAAMESRRPTANQWWREQVRKCLRQSFRKSETGNWSLPALAGA